MLRTAIRSSRNGGGALYQQWRNLSQRSSSPSVSSATVSSAVNSMLLRSLKDHYLEISNMSAPPKVAPPSNFLIVKGALDSNGPVLKRNFNNEEISISVMRLADVVEGDVENDSGNDEINQLFVHIEVCKPTKNQSLNFLCGLYPDALGIQSVSLRPKSEGAMLFAPNDYTGPAFENIDEMTRDAFHNYIIERGINETLFPFLQAWLYVKDHRNLMRWFQSVGLLVSGREAMKEIKQAKGAASANEPKVARGT